MMIAWALSALLGTLAQAPPAGDPFPPEIVSFQPPSEPIFRAAGPGHWDTFIRERGWILREEGEYHLWFTGYIDKKTGPMALGYATSHDGIQWTRHPQNPIVADDWVEDVQVVRDGDTLFMVAEGRGDRAQLLSSTDRIHWKKLGTLDVRQSTGQPLSPGPFGTPTLFVEAPHWNLFYERFDRGIWWARSTDRKVWTNVQDDPVIRPGPEPYDAQAVALNQIVPFRGRYYAFYHGLGNEGPGRWCTCVAVSEDLANWRKYPGNPLTLPSANQSSGILVPEGESFRLYTMHPDVRLHRPAR
jgi:sucrose-6-phosphate hydrolase SacC (GH32 family)